jgi:hypothetical protein
MRRELEERLCEDFPDLFRQYSYSKGSYYALHIACGDGWEPIIRRLSEKITKIVETTVEPDLNSGGTEILVGTEDRKGVEGSPTLRLTRRDFRFMYIKEKHGMLHLSLSQCTLELGEAMNEARQESRHTCEICGRPGKFGPMWLSVFCSDHGFDDHRALNFGSSQKSESNVSFPFRY